MRQVEGASTRVRRLPWFPELLEQGGYAGQIWRLVKMLPEEDLLLTSDVPIIRNLSLRNRLFENWLCTVYADIEAAFMGLHV